MEVICLIQNHSIIEKMKLKLWTLDLLSILFINQLAFLLKEKKKVLISSSESYANSNFSLKKNHLICQIQDLYFFL